MSIHPKSTRKDQIKPEFRIPHRNFAMALVFCSLLGKLILANPSNTLLSHPLSKVVKSFVNVSNK